MYHLTSGILGGIVAAFTLSSLATDLARPNASTLLVSPVSARNLSEQIIAPNYINRTFKGDRSPVGAEKAEKHGTERPPASVEMICVSNVTVVDRDCSGLILFDTESLANLTMVARGFELSEVTNRASNRVPAKPVLRERSRKPGSTMPIGCESAFGAFSESASARIPARCVSNVQDGRKLAAIFQ